MTTATKPKLSTLDVVWKANPGGQRLFVNCPHREALAEGTRGGGKSDGLLMTFARHCEKGYRHAWSGVLFRQSFPDLNDIIKRSKKWFPLIFGNRVEYNEQKYRWVWKSGEELLFRHMDNAERDYNAYHGHEYPWIGWEELTNWPDDSCFKVMMSCCRSSTPGVPRMIRSTTNPYGPGRNWVKARYRLPEFRNRVIRDATDVDGNVEPPRVAIFIRFSENIPLVKADPKYMEMSVLPSAMNDAQRRAWAIGDWDTAAGGMFDEAWLKAKKYALVKSFEPSHIPHSWRITRSFDWGWSKPFSVGWWAISDGTTLQPPGHEPRLTVKGDAFRIKEWYGTTGQPNKGLQLTAEEISQGIIEREVRWGIHHRVKPGPADAQIFSQENGNCYAHDMEKDILVDGKRYSGIYWTPATKKDGSRVDGWQKLNARLLATIPLPQKYGHRETPGLFILDECRYFVELVPFLSRDPKNTDDVNTKEEDHCLSGDTMVVTDRGDKKIVDLVGTEGNVLTLHGWKPYRSCRMTRSNEPTVQIDFDDGRKVICTKDHRFLCGERWVEAKDILGEGVVKCDAVNAFVVSVSIKGCGAVRVTDHKDQPVYCLTVPDAGHFAIEGGLIVKNCADEVRYLLYDEGNTPTYVKVSGR